MEQLIALIKSGVTQKPEGVDDTTWNMAISLAFQGTQVETTAVAVVDTTTTAVAVAQPAEAFSAEAFLTSGMDVDHWLKVAHGSTSVGDKQVLTPTISVTVDLEEVFYKKGIKTQTPTGEVKYAYTTDDIHSTDGELWSKVVDDFSRINPSTKIKPFRSADLKLKVAQDVLGLPNPDGSQNIIAVKDEILGNTLSTTSWYSWQEVLKELKSKGQPLNSGTIKLEVGREDIVNQNKQKYAVLKFKIVE